MRSLRTRITLLTVIVVVLAVSITAALSVVFIRRTEKNKSDQLLLLLCETGERNLDYYFNNVQRAVEKLSSHVSADLDGLEDQQLARHVEAMRVDFLDIASRTDGVLTFYYRIDPEVSDTVKGFWYTNLDGNEFVEHAVTDITLYDTEDTSQLVWFTVPKHEGKPVWIPPYITDNLNYRVISYNVPIYWRGNFVGVVGIEVDYAVMAEQVDSIRLYNNGYAYLSDEEGNLFYHPRIDVTRLTPETTPTLPDGARADSTFLRYTFEGVEKTAAWLPLSNGMRLNVAVPVAETQGDWQKLIWNIVIVAGEVLIAASAFTMLYTRRITRPLEELTEAAEQLERGNYDFDLSYDRDDEVGRLTNTFKRLADHMKEHISDLNKRVYVDALTSVRNKGAYTSYMKQLQERLDEDEEGTMAFAVCIFDCDDLKVINDRYGHEKGDIYLKTASRLICRVFQHSPVFRIGGDEFSVILQNEDYENREALAAQFRGDMAKICASTQNPWEQAHVAMGLAEYNRKRDRYVNDVIRRADQSMYADKRVRKSGR